MKEREYIDYIQDILDSINDIEEFTQGMDFDNFGKDKKTIYAVIRAIEIIGEATKNIPDIIRKKHPNIEWKKIAGMRDIIIHAYFTLDLDLIWEIIQNKLSELKEKIEKVIEDL